MDVTKKVLKMVTLPAMSKAGVGVGVMSEVTSVVNASLDIKDSQNVMVSLL